MRTPLLLASTVVAATLLAACGDDADDTPAAPMEMSSEDMGSEDLGAEDMGSEAGHGEEGHDDANSPVADGARRIEVVGDAFRFEPEQLTVAVGEDIAVVLTSEDVLHDLTIDELDAHVAADAGETATGGFTADAAGRYTYYCSVPGHREAGMEGTLTVEA